MRGFNSWSGRPNDKTNELLLSNFTGKMFELLVHPRLVGSDYGKLLKLVPVYLLPSQRNKWAIQETVKKLIVNK